MMRDAAQQKYAVGYFESWSLESLLAVADAATATRAPVLLGFSGIYLPHPRRRTREHLTDYIALAQAVAARLTVPTCLVFNESPHLDWVERAIELGFGLVMYSPDASQSNLTNHKSEIEKLQALISRVRLANLRSLCCVEAEIAPLPGVGGKIGFVPEDRCLTDPDAARAFVARTRIDALAVNLGQVHLHGRGEVRLDLERLRAIRAAVDVPLVLHGATSVNRDDLRAAIAIGVQKINVGSALKRVYFESLRAACGQIGAAYNPYDVMGSGLDADVLTTARLALQHEIEDWMQLFSSAGRAP